MSTDARQQLLHSLADKEFREAFAGDIGTGLAFQIKLLREKRGWTQEELARRAGKRQETVSQWEDPDYGRYTISTLKDLANAFDVALVVRFASFGELVDWTANLNPERLAPPSFEEERQLSFYSIVGGNDWPTLTFTPSHALDMSTAVGAVSFVFHSGGTASWPSESPTIGIVRPEPQEQGKLEIAHAAD